MSRQFPDKEDKENYKTFFISTTFHTKYWLFLKVNFEVIHNIYLYTYKPIHIGLTQSYPEDILLLNTLTHKIMQLFWWFYFS